MNGLETETLWASNPSASLQEYAPGSIKLMQVSQTVRAEMRVLRGHFRSPCHSVDSSAPTGDIIYISCGTILNDASE